MIHILFAALLVQSPLTESPPPSAGQKALNVTGCVQSEGAPPSRFTLYDPHRGIMYRLTGKGVGLYAGKRVHVVGGLMPSPNVAAQTGSIDPAGPEVSALAGPSATRSGVTPFNQLKL